MKTSFMNATALLLAAGVGALTAYWVAHPKQPSPADQPDDTVVPAAGKPARNTAVDGVPAVVVTEPEPFHWRQLESPDFKQYIANLRSVGCPEQTIRDIVSAEVRRLYSERHAALETPAPHRQKYWEPRREQGPKAHYELRLKHRELDREQEALMTELLGPPEGDEGTPTPEFSQDLKDEDPSRLSHALAEQVHEIQEKYAHLREEVFHQSDGRIYPADADRLRELQEQRLTELSQVLDPEQLQEFDLREGPIAEQLRHQLGPFQPSETEFRAIHEVRQSFAGELGPEPFDFEEPDYRENREQAEQQMNEQLRSVLGEERFAEYQQSLDPRYRDLYALGERFELPAENVDQMYDLWRTSEQMVDEVHGNPELDPERKQQILQAFRSELQSEAQRILGNDAYYNYRNRGGEWISHLFGEEATDVHPF